MFRDLFNIEVAFMLFFLGYLPAMIYLWNKLCKTTHSAPKGKDDNKCSAEYNSK